MRLKLAESQSILNSYSSPTFSSSRLLIYVKNRLCGRNVFTLKQTQENRTGSQLRISLQNLLNAFHIVLGQLTTLLYTIHNIFPCFVVLKMRIYGVFKATHSHMHAKWGLGPAKPFQNKKWNHKCLPWGFLPGIKINCHLLINPPLNYKCYKA